MVGRVCPPYSCFWCMVLCMNKLGVRTTYQEWENYSMHIMHNLIPWSSFLLPFLPLPLPLPSLSLLSSIPSFSSPSFPSSLPAFFSSLPPSFSRSLRMLTLLLNCARLRMLMAWCSTLGGAHSSLGETFVTHVCEPILSRS